MIYLSDVSSQNRRSRWRKKERHLETLQLMRGLSEAAAAAEATSDESSPTGAAGVASLMPQANSPPHSLLPHLQSAAAMTTAAGSGDPKWPPASSVAPVYAAQWPFYTQQELLTSSLASSLGVSVNPSAMSMPMSAASALNSVPPVAVAADCNRNHQHQLLLQNNSQDRYTQALTSYALVNYYGANRSRCSQEHQPQPQQQQQQSAQLANALSIVGSAASSASSAQHKLDSTQCALPAFTTWPQHTHPHAYAQHFGIAQRPQQQHAISLLSAACDPSCV